MNPSAVETQRRVVVAKRLASSLECEASAVYAGGSLGYGAGYSVRPTSDIDLVVLASRASMIPVAKRLGLEDDAVLSDAVSAGSIDMVRVDCREDDIDTSVFVYDQSAFQEFLFVRRGKLGCWRSNEPRSHSSGRFFDGSSVLSPLNPEPFGSGWRYTRAGFVNNRYVGSVPRQDMFGHMSFYNANLIDDIMARAWSAATNRLIIECGPSIRRGSFSVLNTFCAGASDRVSPEQRELLDVRAANALSAAGYVSSHQ